MPEDSAAHTQFGHSFNSRSITRLLRHSPPAVSGLCCLSDSRPRQPPSTAPVRPPAVMCAVLLGACSRLWVAAAGDLTLPRRRCALPTQVRPPLTMAEPMLTSEVFDAMLTGLPDGGNLELKCVSLDAWGAACGPALLRCSFRNGGAQCACAPTPLLPPLPSPCSTFKGYGGEWYVFDHAQSSAHSSEGGAAAPAVTYPQASRVDANRRAWRWKDAAARVLNQVCRQPGRGGSQHRRWANRDDSTSWFPLSPPSLGGGGGLLSGGERAQERLLPPRPRLTAAGMAWPCSAACDRLHASWLIGPRPWSPVAAWAPTHAPAPASQLVKYLPGGSTRLACCHTA